MRQAYKLLKMLTEKYQPPEGGHHSITFQEGKLTITLFVGERFYPFDNEEDADLDMPAEITYQEIVEVMNLLLEVPGEQE